MAVMVDSKNSHDRSGAIASFQSVISDGDVIIFVKDTTGVDVGGHRKLA